MFILSSRAPDWGSIQEHIKAPPLCSLSIWRKNLVSDGKLFRVIQLSSRPRGQRFFSSPDQEGVELLSSMRVEFLAASVRRSGCRRQTSFLAEAAFDVYSLPGLCSVPSRDACGKDRKYTRAAQRDRQIAGQYDTDLKAEGATKRRHSSLRIAGIHALCAGLASLCVRLLYSFSSSESAIIY